ncbi:MAG: sulfite exporter TauE/SafE family protein [Pseudomonadota bacterium]
MDIFQAVMLMGIGLVGGLWNAVAGGATLFTFPALMAAGLPPIIANTTNYVALLPSNAAALPACKDELRGLGRTLVPLLVVSGLGAICGSLMLLVSDAEVFSALIPFLILAATCLFAFGDRLRERLLAVSSAATGQKLLYGVLFICSIYGGYFGAGLGIILLGLAQIMGFRDFHVANSIKNLLATNFTILSIIVFNLGGLIAWPEAFTIMVGSTLGGFAGGHLSKRANQAVLRAVVIVFGFALSIVYFYKQFLA